VDQAKGKLKQAVATLTSNKRLKLDGKVDEAVGKVEVAAGRATRRAVDAIAAPAKSKRR
jgi:uncharacterized protein YjbJ (UPF0337 family)